MARAGTAWIDIEGDFSKLNRQVARYASSLDRKFDPVELRLDTGRLNRDASGAAASLRGVSSEGDRVGRQLHVSSRSADSFGSALMRTRRNSEGLHGSLLRLRLIMGALAVIPAGQGLSALGAGAVAATSSLGPLTGVLAAIPTLASTAAQAIGTVQLASMGIADTIKAASAARDAAGRTASSAADAQAQATERVRTSELALGDAHRQVKYAQESLTAARRDARRELADLEDQMERGRLSESRARLALRQAEQDVRRLASDPNASLMDLEDAQLRVREARQDLDETRKDARRARADFAKAEKQGVDQAPKVVAAERQKADAIRARDEAQRQLTQATKAMSDGAGEASSAVSKLNVEMAKLSPEARAFAEHMISLQPTLDDLRAAAGRDLFPGLSDGITSAQRNLGPLEKILEQTGGAFGDVAQDAGDLVGSPAFGHDMAIIGERNAEWIEQLGGGAVDLTSALRHLIVSSGPFVGWLVDTADAWAEQALAAADAGRRTGETADFLERTRAILERLASITQSTADGLFAVGRAGTDLGDDMWASIDRAAQRFESWAESAEGQNSLEEWFESARRVGGDLGRAIDEMADRFSGLRDEGRSTFDALAIMGSEAFARILSHAAERLAREAPTIAEAFIRGWLAADAWGRLLASAWLLKRMGGLGAFAAMGAKAGTSMGAATGAAAASSMQLSWTRVAGGGMLATLGQASGQQMGRSMGPAVASGVAASGLRGRLGTMFAGWGPGLAAALGLTLGPEIAKDIQTRMANTTGSFDLPKTRTLGFDLTGGWLTKLIGPLDTGETKLREFGDRAEKTFEKLRNAGDSRGLGDLAQRARALAREFPQASAQLGRFADAAETAAREAAGAFRDVSKIGGKSLRDIKSATADTDFEIRNKLGPGTYVAREAMAKNFAAAAKAVKKSMDAGVISTKTGTEQIEKYMVAALQSTGFTKEQALRIRKGRDPVSNKNAASPYTGKQRGGPIDMGAPTGDSVPAMLERGEYVLNRKAVAKMGRGTLDRINFGAAPRFQSGGIVPIPGQPGESIHSSILGDVVRLIRQYRLRITDGYAASGHAAGGEHPKGLAIDAVPGAGGSWDLVDKLARWAEPAQNQPRPPFRWVGYNGDPGHGRGHHLHLSWGGGGGALGALGELAPKVARVLLDGPDSPLKTMAQGALDTTRAAAQSLVDSVGGSAGASGEGLEHGAGAGKGVATRAQMVAWARTALKRTGIFPASAENIEKILTLARKESSWQVDSINNWDSNAKAGNPSGGLMHVTRDKMNGADLFDPVLNMMASIRYQKERYGQLITHSPYRLGGLVEMFQAGGAPGQRSRSLKLPKRPKRKSSKSDKSAASEWRPAKYVHKLAEVVAGGKFAEVGKTVDGLVQEYGNVERRQGLTEEQSTKRVKVADATDAELAGHGLKPDEIARLRAEPDREIELLNQPDILQRVGELDGLVGIKTQIAERLGEQQRLAGEALAAFQNGIAERIARAEAIRERARENIKKIRALYDRLQEMNRQESRAKGAKARRALERRHAPERKRIGGQIDKLRGENQTLVGSPSVDVDLKAEDGTGGLLRSAVSSRKAWETARDDLAPDAEGIGQKIVDTVLDRDYLLKERRAWIDTPPPGIDVPAPAEPDTSGLADLLKEQLTQANRRTAVSEAQFAVLRGMPPFGGVFHEGGVVPGPVGAERMILAQGGERVTPIGGDGASVRVVIEDQRVRVFVDEIEQAVERVTRRQARQAGRMLPGGARGI